MGKIIEIIGLAIADTSGDIDNINIGDESTVVNGDDTTDIVVSKIRFMRDGYNKNSQTIGPVYVVESGDDIRDIIKEQAVTAVRVRIREEEEEANTRTIPPAKKMEAPVGDGVDQTVSERVDPVVW